MVAGRESLYGLAGKEKTRKRSLLPFFLLGIAAAAFAMLFLEEEGDYQQFMTEVGWVFGFSGMAVTAGLGVYTLVKKGRKNEK